MRRVAAVVLAPRSSAGDPTTTEFLRLLAALRAYEIEVDLVEAGAGVGTLADPADLDPDAERYLAALREDGVEVAPPSRLAPALASADAVVVLPDPGRTRLPSLLRLTRGESPTAEALARLASAGQVLLD